TPCCQNRALKYASITTICIAPCTIAAHARERIDPNQRAAATSKSVLVNWPPTMKRVASLVSWFATTTTSRNDETVHTNIANPTSGPYWTTSELLNNLCRTVG